MELSAQLLDQQNGAGIKPARRLLSAQDILGVDDVKTEDVDVPEWGGTVRLRGMTGSQRDRWERDLISIDGENVTIKMRDKSAQFVQRCAIKEDGSPLFTMEQIEALSKKNGRALARLAKVGAKLSGIGKEETDKMGEAFGDQASED